jgi:FSR family fosmidomycin resistance protein-like MFS transporter
MATAASISDARKTEERRALAVACGAHALHDGYTDLIYVLLPIWQAEFGLSYAEVGLLRGAFAGAMAAFQIPAGWLSERIGAATMLAAGTALSALAFLTVGTAAGFVTLVVLLLVGGLGSSVQHPIASSVVARAFAGAGSRIAIGNYNFAGDVGKMALPAATAFLLAVMTWRTALIVIAGVGLAAAVAIFLFTPRMDSRPADQRARHEERRPGFRVTQGAFGYLLGIGAIDSATRMAFLTFLPFVLVAKGASIAVVGVALALVFAGGAAGKLVCAHLGVRYGVLATVVLTEALTAVGIAALLQLPLWACLTLLPVVGVALNGTSSVLYGSVPELVAPERHARAFGVFYTATIGSGAIAPAIYGVFSDSFGVPAAMLLIAAVVLTTVPLALLLKPALPRSAA